MKILIVKLSSLGDVVHALPTLEALRRTFPGAEISWLVESEWVELILGHPALDEVIVSSRKDWVKRLLRGDLEVLREASSFIRGIRRRRFDLVIDLQGLMRSGLLVGLTRARRKLGFNGTREFSYMFYNEKLPPYDPDLHAVLRYLSVAGHLGAVPGEPVFRIPWGRKEELAADRLLGPLGNEPGPLVAMNVTGSWATKRWGADNFRQTARMLMERSGARLVFVGGPGDSAYVAAASRGLSGKGCIDISGQTGLKELACLLSRADLMVTTDSGPMHISAAVNTPVVAVFGPTDPARTGPFGQGHRTITANVACRPCFKRRCPYNMECMREVGAHEVYQEAKELLFAGSGAV